LIMAAGTVVAVPVWLAALAAQKYLVRGLSLGAVK
jgi:ABC-type glycerol-3-phosphate transport system permease component